MTDRLDVFRALLRPLPPGRLLDLATGHGAFAMAASDLGWTVTGVDVRTVRFPADRDDITWIRSDIRHYRFDPADFDVITVLGLLYHLPLTDQMDLLRRCVGAATIVDTHISNQPVLRQGGYDGHLFDEDAGRGEAARQRSGTASWNNRWSFWATLESTERMLHDAGFRHTFRLSPPLAEDRTWWWCL